MTCRVDFPPLVAPTGCPGMTLVITNPRHAPLGTRRKGNGPSGTARKTPRSSTKPLFPRPICPFLARALSPLGSPSSRDSPGRAPLQVHDSRMLPFSGRSRLFATRRLESRRPIIRNGRFSRPTHLVFKTFPGRGVTYHRSALKLVAVTLIAHKFSCLEGGTN